MSWKPYVRNRLIKPKEGYSVIIPAESSNPIPLSCSNCGFLYRTRLDEQSHIDHSCCHLCALKWAHPNKEKWKDGWRPTKDEIREELENRPGINVIVHHS